MALASRTSSSFVSRVYWPMSASEWRADEAEQRRAAQLDSGESDSYLPDFLQE